MEVKYRKFYISAGQQLADLPTLHRLKKSGWQIAWSYQREDIEGPYIETLLQRSMAKQSEEARMQ